MHLNSSAKDATNPAILLAAKKNQEKETIISTTIQTFLDE